MARARFEESPASVRLSDGTLAHVRALRVRRRVGAPGRRHPAVARRPRRSDAPALRVRRPHGRGDRPAADAAPAAHRRAPGRRRPHPPALRRCDPPGFAPAGDRARAGARRARAQRTAAPPRRIDPRAHRRRPRRARTPARRRWSATSTCSSRTSTPGAQTPAHLTTVEFYTAAARLLAPEGVLLVNVADGAGLAFARRQVATVRAVLAARDRARRGAGAQGPAVRQPRDRGIPRAAAHRVAAAAHGGGPASRPRSRRAPSSTSSRAARAWRRMPMPRRRRSPRHPSSSADGSSGSPAIAARPSCRNRPRAVGAHWRGEPVAAERSRR